MKQVTGIALILTATLIACRPVPVPANTRTAAEQSIQQDTTPKPMIIEGSYQGYNILIQNPESGTGFCVKSVVINGKTMDAAETQQSAFELKFSAMGLDTGSLVKIEIYHHDGCKPKVLDPRLFMTCGARPDTLR